MKTNKLLLLLSIISILTTVESFGQKFSPQKRYVSIGGSLNSMQYFGDITPLPSRLSFDIRFNRPQLGFFIQKRYTPNISGRLSLSAGRLEGDDFTSANPENLDNPIFRWRRNLHFRNDIIELGGSVIIDFFENRGVFYKRPNGFIPYVTLGVAGFYNNPRAKSPEELGGDWVNLRKLKTEGKAYSPIQISFPVGLGVRYKLSAKMDLAFEVGYRFTLTDYIDDVAGNYQDQSSFGGNDLAWRMSDRSRESKAMLKGKDRDAKHLGATPVSVNGGYFILNTTGAKSADGTNLLPGYGYADQPDMNFNNGKNNRGDFNGQKDMYVVTGFQLSYILGGQVRCPKFR